MTKTARIDEKRHNFKKLFQRVSLTNDGSTTCVAKLTKRPSLKLMQLILFLSINDKTRHDPNPNGLGLSLDFD